MKRFWSMFAMVTAFLLVGCFAWAADAPPETVDGLMAYLGKFLEGITKGDYQIAGGVLVMALMVAVRQYGFPKWNIDANALPYYSAILAAIAYGGLAMTNGQDFVEALKNGLVASLLAGGIWDAFGKYLAKLLLGDKYAEPPVKSEVVKTIQTSVPADQIIVEPKL